MRHMTDYQIEHTAKSMLDRVRNRVSLFGGDEVDSDKILLLMAADAIERANRPGEPTRQQRYAAKLAGHDAAADAITWVEMTEKEAIALIEDIDPEVLDCYEGPNLSGEMADSTTPQSLAESLGWNAFEGDAYSEGVYTLAVAWMEECDTTWSELRDAAAYRVLDKPETAEQLENRVVARRSYLESQSLT